MPDEIEKTEQPNPDDVLAAIQSFNDPTIITNMFNTLGWSYSMEIRETLMMAKQNANLSIKFKAIKHLRELLREAAEAAGYVAKVSQTVPNADGGSTTFSAKRISGILNPVKKITSTEIKGEQNDEIKQSNRGCDRGQSEGNQDPGSEREICGGNTPTSDYTKSGGIEPADGGETTERRPDGIGNSGWDITTEGGEYRKQINDYNDGGSENPCVKVRPPQNTGDLYPGISTSAEELC